MKYILGICRAWLRMSEYLDVDRGKSLDLLCSWIVLSVQSSPMLVKVWYDAVFSQILNLSKDLLVLTNPSPSLGWDHPDLSLSVLELDCREGPSFALLCSFLATTE